MAKKLAPVNGTRKCIAYGSGQTGEDESLELASSITNFNGQRLKFLRAHGRAYKNLRRDRKSTRLNSSHRTISYAVFCLKKKNKTRYYSCFIWVVVDRR